MHQPTLQRQSFTFKYLRDRYFENPVYFFKTEKLFFAVDRHVAVLYDTLTLEQLDFYASKTKIIYPQTYLEQNRGEEI